VYRGVTTVNDATKIMSKFIHSYREHKETKPFLIVLDSLDALITDNAQEAYDTGIVKGDQGQKAKQLKAMLAPFVHDIKDLNLAILCTKQVYKTQDAIEAKNPVTEWKLTDTLKYPFTQIALITRLMMKDKDTKNYEGIVLKVFGLKTRFTKPFQQAKIEVPYDTGMDPYTGVLEVAVSMGIVTLNGSWYTYGDKKFQSKNFSSVQEAVLEELIKRESEAIHVSMADAEVVVEEGDMEEAA
jgi:recombination protein RecA